MTDDAMTDERWPLGTGSLRERMAAAVADPEVPPRIARAVDRFAKHHAKGLAELGDADGGDVDALRHRARSLKAEILAELPALLDELEAAAAARGVVVHRAQDAESARRIVAGITGPRRVVKSKSMATEEIGLEAALEAEGAHVVETDLGEWIIQLAGETPSHIIAPAVHHDRHSILEVFERVAGAHGVAAEPEALNAFARSRLRSEFLAAEVGITGVNFAVVESGSLVLVTNEGNGRMVTSLPPVHIAVLGAERLVRTWEELDLFLTLLTRSATGQRLTSYTSVITGPRRTGEPDGPDEVHLVIVDNGRTALLGTAYEEMLGCLRCGACLNVCPVYRQTGGHAYGWVYPGPMGAVLTPLLLGHGSASDAAPGISALVASAAEVPGASTLCGACTDACPVAIPLPDLLVRLREERAEHHASRSERSAWRAWSQTWSRPAAYRASVRTAGLGARAFGSHVAHLPGAAAWSEGRSVPRLAPDSFHRRWARLVRSADGVVPAREGAVPPVLSGRPGAPVSEAQEADMERVAPAITYRTVDPEDLLGSFVRAATQAGARVHVADGPQVPTALLERLAEEHDVRSVVATAEPEAVAAAHALAHGPAGCTVHVGGDADRGARAGADMGITSASALVAATGSLVVDASTTGDRTTSLLPRVHLAVVPADRLVATPAEVWQELGRLAASGRDPVPSNLVVITGPSRTGDIEQLLTLGVHGPQAVEIVVLT